MERMYNCRRYQYETGEHITFFMRPIVTGKEEQQEEMEDIPEVMEIGLNQKERTKEDIFHSIRVSNSRAKNKVYRIARSNKWDWFITLAFDRKKTDASDYDAIIYRLEKFLNNLQQRKCPDMKYLIIAELHKDEKNYHFHGLLANVDALRFRFWKVDRKKKLPIYNILDWSYGYTTATRVVDTARVSSYITKYISKDVDKHLQNKRRFYYSRSCHIAEEEHFFLDENEFRKLYADRIKYMKTVDIPQATQQITYYELSY